jgi:hypothetical protein
MLALFTLGNIVSFAAGGALIWFCKATIQKWVIGANALSAKLHDQADNLMKRF